MSKPSHIRALLLVAVFALVISACSSSTTPVEVSTSPPSSVTSSTVAPTTTTSTPTTLPAPTTTALEDSTTSTTVAPQASGWIQVASDRSVFGGSADQVVVSIVEGGPGLVAVGRDGNDGALNAAVWTSSNGIDWARVPDDDTVFGGSGSQAMFGVAASESGLVAVGYDASGGDADAAVWTSSDGITWTRVTHDESVFGGADDQDMLSITAGGPGFVAVGDDYASGESDGAVWTSPDGVTWKRVTGAALGGVDTQIIESVAAAGDDLVAVGYEYSGSDWDGVVWTSSDGATWTRAADPGSVLAGSNNEALLGVTAGGPGLIAVGYDDANGDWDTRVWTSADGSEWTLLPADPAVFGGSGDQQIAKVVEGGPGFVAVGRESTGNGSDAIVWVSSDGIEWTRADDPGSVFGGPRSQRIFGVAATTYGVFAVGFTETPAGDWDAAIWMLAPSG